MNGTWHSVRLGQLLRKSEEWIDLEPERQYREVTVRLWGKGTVLRGIRTGAEIAAGRRRVVRQDQLILSRIDARNGALGIVPAPLDGAVVSNDFPVFNINRSLALPAFLGWLVKTESFVGLCKGASEGTTNRVRLKEEKFLDTPIFLPPLDAQHRLVARLDTLTAGIQKAHGLRQESLEETDKILAAEEMRLWPLLSLEGAPTLDSVTTYLARGRQSKQGPSEHLLIKTQHVQLGKYVKTTLALDPYVASKVSEEARVRPGDILIACSAAGCLGRVAFYDDTNRVASTDTHVAIARPNPQLILPEYLYAYLRGAQGQIQLRSREKGDWTREKVGFRLTELNVADMRRVPVPLPSIPEQRHVVAYLGDLRKRVDSVKQLQAGTAAELGALVPSILHKAFSGEL